MIWRSRKKYQKQSDQELILAYQEESDTGALAALFKRYSHFVSGLCYHYLNNAEDCEDAVMEVYMILSESLKKDTITNIQGWLFQVVKNHCLRKLEQRKKREDLFVRNETLIESVKQTTTQDENTQEKNVLLGDIKKALHKLNPLQQKCISLFYLQGYTYQEICETTSLPIHKVKSHIQNGKRNIKNALAIKT